MPLDLSSIALNYFRHARPIAALVPGQVLPRQRQPRKVFQQVTKDERAERAALVDRDDRVDQRIADNRC